METARADERAASIAPRAAVPPLPRGPAASSRASCSNICGARSGLLRRQLNHVQNLLETLATLQLEVAESQTALDHLQAQTWHVWLRVDADATRYVVLPMGTLEFKRPHGTGSAAAAQQWDADYQQRVEELDILRARAARFI